MLLNWTVLPFWRFYRIRMVSIEHLQRVRLANIGCLLLWAPCPVSLRIKFVLILRQFITELVLSMDILVSNISRYFYFAYFDLKNIICAVINTSKEVKCRLLREILIYNFSWKVFRKGVCLNHCTYKEWMSFFWMHWEWIGAQNKQIALEPRHVQVSDNLNLFQTLTIPITCLRMFLHVTWQVTSVLLKNNFRFIALYDHFYMI